MFKKILKVISIVASVLDILVILSPRYHKLKKDFNVLGAGIKKLETDPDVPTAQKVKIGETICELADHFGITDRLRKKLNEAGDRISKKLKKLGVSLK
ncbi:hypothetical protein ES702_07402 [subsurface metagenome]